MKQMPDQEKRYREAAAEHGPAMQRLARAMEADPARRQDLLQEMHVALWRSLAGFDGRCSLKTWVYRVAHNTASTHVGREVRRNRGLVGVEAIGDLPGHDNQAAEYEREDALEHLNAWIRALKPADRQVMTLYLEELDAPAIAEITGFTPGAVMTRISRLKARLAKDFKEAKHD
ncbi:RNA polymerase sigma factor [Hyphomonas sp. WL0036]|uniref:RNA polymerase sigma factor n=1 Tax=Hyphomonas sediminis TaxID=2866160 RepID=UPI001C7E25E9|nr:RNA polymerase sigma factor [Hyphomonas sediminis]MBY9066166.1 RNA polymerase sigma factor [Hyphomonas sediminis]